MALGALFECQKRGIKVPEAMSIIGFNDLEFAAAATPPLATVVTPRYEMGERAAKTVMRMIETGERPAERRIDLGFALERRGSIADRR
jgi:LacI family gluconate utilization system Gnt-I transcriptional repressor